MIVVFLALISLFHNIVQHVDIKIFIQLVLNLWVRIYLQSIFVHSTLIFVKLTATFALDQNNVYLLTV